MFNSETATLLDIKTRDITPTLRQIITMGNILSVLFVKNELLLSVIHNKNNDVFGHTSVYVQKRR